MNSVVKRRIDGSERACLSCQKRKTKCFLNPGSNICSYCTRAGKECVFSCPPARTPLTRKNFDALETRCRRLEAQLARLRTQQLHSPESGSSDNTSINTQDQIDGHGNDNDDEVLEQAQSTFEWHESPDLNSIHDPKAENAGDGMASLALRRRGLGYLGSSSGSNLLECVSTSSNDDRETRNLSYRVNKDFQASPLKAQTPSIPSLGNMTSSVVHEYLIGAYFKAYNSSYPIIHEGTFRRECTKRLNIPRDSAWHIMYLMVLAIGDWVMGFGDDAPSLYYDAARSRMTIATLESGNMYVVQAFLLLGNYLQKRDRPNTAYNYLGVAYRVALGLGLHREIPLNREKETLAQQQRRLVFWTLYSFDSGFSLTTGRPILVADSFIDVRKPQNIDDSKCDLTSCLPSEVDYPTACSAMVAQSRLAEITNRIHTDFLSTRACPEADHLTLIMEQAIKDWQASLPGYFFSSNVPEWFLGPRTVLFWKCANTHMLLLLASRRHQKDPHSRRRNSAKCQDLAIKLITDICKFCEDYTRLLHNGLSWYAVYYLLQSILAFGTHKILDWQEDWHPESPPQLGSVWEHTIQQARRCLANLGSRNGGAVRTLHVLNCLPHCIGIGKTGQDSSGANDAQRESNAIAALHQLASTHQQGASEQKNVGSMEVQEPPDFTLTGTTTTDPIVPQYLDRSWATTLDPSLHVFFDAFDGSTSVEGIFNDLEGFPSSNDRENFDYFTSGM